MLLLSVENMVESELNLKVQSFHAEVSNLVRGNTTVSELEYEQASEHLHHRIQSKFSLNISKFHLYAMSNIFINNINQSPIISMDNGVNDNKNLQLLREKYLLLQSQCGKLKIECQHSDALLKDMRSSIFNIRVGTQSFAEYQVEPIEDSVNRINESKHKLFELCSVASVIIDQIDQPDTAHSSQGTA
eukprot:gene16062-21812_t